MVEFDPPEIVFGFEFEVIITLYTPPTVSLGLGFEFTVTLKLGFALDTKGIREAITQQAPEKALSSFALKDTFDGVDEPMITITGRVTLEISVSAAIVKVSAYGGIFFVAEIDLYDPDPETSGGLIRPFELLAAGESPLNWFEFDIEIYVFVGVSIEVGIFAGPFEITLYERRVEYSQLLLALTYIPALPDPLANITFGKLEFDPSNVNVTCTRLSGDLGQEEVECQSGKQFNNFKDVKDIVLPATSSLPNYEFRDISSPIKLSADIGTFLRFGLLCIVIHR